MPPPSGTPQQAESDLRGIVLGYASVDAERSEWAVRELRRQAEEIISVCERRRLDLLEVVRERKRKHQRPLERPGLRYALEQIAAGQAGGLVVAELAGITDSAPELGRVLEWLCGRGARFVAGAPGLDTDENAGRLAVRAIIDVCRREREQLLERTRIGMRAARGKGPASVADYPELRERIAKMRADGMTLQAIADQLNEEGVPTVRGGTRWRPSSVQAAVGYQRPGREPSARPLDHPDR